MQDYCEDHRECRRRFFSSKFGETLCAGGSSSARAFNSCGTMCDNCLANRDTATSRRALPPKQGSKEPEESGAEGTGRKRKGREGGGFRSARSLVLEMKENERNAGSEVICLDQGERNPWVSVTRQRR